MWGYIIDGILILAIIVSAIIGIVKGFFDSILSLLGTGLSFIIAVFTAKFLSGTLNKIINIEQFVLDKLAAANIESEIKLFGGKIIYGHVEVAKFAVWIVTVIVLFLIIKFLIFILAKIFESVTKNSPTISGINRVLGMVFGIAKGGVWVVITLALCCALGQVPTIGNTINDKIAQTKITSFAYKYVDDFVEKNLTKEKIDGIISKIISDNKPGKNKTDTPSDSTNTTENTETTPQE